MNDHLAKPIEPETVIKTVRRWVGAKTLNEAALRTLLREFRRHHAASFTELNNAHESGNRAAAKALLHTLKGSAANIGAREVAAAAAELEPLFEAIPDTTTVQAVLRALARRLSENDTRAEETLADLRNVLAGSEPAWLSAASAAIERLDYAAALAALPPHA